MRGIRIHDADHVLRPIVALARDYPDGFEMSIHRHRRGQLIASRSGLLVVTTPDGTVVMPPHRGVWIPPGVLHRLQTVGDVSTQSLYVEPGFVPALPCDCRLLEVSPLLSSLIEEAVTLPLEYDLVGRPGALMQLIEHELGRIQVSKFTLPIPADVRLEMRCREFLRRPNVHETIHQWSEVLGMSRRSFTRLFRQETGLSFVSWRQMACLVTAMPRLAAGESVTTVAIDLGYENPAAFTAMFKRAFGSAPLAYVGKPGGRGAFGD